MKTNISSADRLVRLLLGIVLIVLSQQNLENDPLLNIVLLSIGIFLIITVIINYCAIYAFLDFSTIKQKRLRRKHQKF